MNENNEFDPEVKENDTTYHYTADQLPTDSRSTASFGSGSWENGSSSYESMPKKKKGSRLWVKILAGILCLALIGGVSFGAGYAGVMSARDAKSKVVIQQVSTTGDSPQLREVESSVLTSEQVAEKVEKSVVAITTEVMKTNNYWYGNYVASGAGSGVVISQDGYILTCAHVISGATKISVELMDGSTHDAQLVGKYVEGDIAVVKIEATDLSPAEIADSDEVKQGAVCYAVGNPEGRFSGSISEGIVSSLGRSITVQVEEENDSTPRGNDFFGGSSLYNMFFNMQGSAYSTIDLDVIQMTAAVSPGNSGGALFNDRGQLIGIVSAKSSDNDSEGLGFAIPSNNAVRISSQLIANGEYVPELSEEALENANTNRAVLGITVITLDPETAAQNNRSAGVYVNSISAESTERAGLAVGDRIISVDDVLVSVSEDITDYLAGKNPGDEVTLNVDRNGKLVSMDIILIENR